jgi:class 3 adenylate cyclase
MRIDPFDFAVFQSKEVLAQRKDRPLQENLRTLMAALLGKALEYSGATSVVHIFANPTLGEAHIMGLTRDTDSWAAVENLSLAREQPGGTRAFGSLPRYHRIEISKTAEVFRLLTASGEPVMSMAPTELTTAFEELAHKDVSFGRRLQGWKDQPIVNVFLAREKFQRLGSFVFLADGSKPGGRDLENFFFFGRAVSRLLVSIFAESHDMQPFTYLPSYYEPQRRRVALMSAEVRHFDLIADILTRRNWSDAQQRHCLSDLVNRFSETVGTVVERFKGRIDQVWGAGLVAVFGEYLDTDADAGMSTCMRAVQAAAEAVTSFDDARKKWFSQEFLLDRFRMQHNQHVTTGLAAAITFESVQFDYIGSKDHRSYMALDHLTAVKALAAMAHRTELDDKDNPRLAAPILVSQAAFMNARRSCIRPKPNQRAEELDAGVFLKIRGSQTPVPIFQLWPENISR